MNQSDGLRNRSKQHKAKNTVSKNRDKEILVVVKEVLATLRINFPNTVFGHDKKILLNDIKAMLPGDLEDTGDKSFITPDGGFIYAIIDGVKKYICIPEEKSQGTNDKLYAEGNKTQGTGNAIERLGKNLKVVELLFLDEDINPFVAFIDGCDFDERHTIKDRVISMFGFAKNKTVNLFKTYTNRSGSYFMKGHNFEDGVQLSKWNKNEKYNVILDICEQATNYYYEKR